MDDIKLSDGRGSDAKSERQESAKSLSAVFQQFRIDVRPSGRHEAMANVTPESRVSIECDVEISRTTS